MGRKLSRPRPKQGARLAEFRRAAGLSQYDLARLTGESQANIAFWELSAKPPRSDALPKLAEVLGVSLQELIGIEAVNSSPRPKSGVAGKLLKAFQEAAQLPRSQQDLIIEFVSLFARPHRRAKKFGASAKALKK